VVETETKDFLEPLYAESVFGKLGVRMYSGLPMGDIRVPAMAGGTAEWEYENADADFTSNDFSSVILKPKRITAYIDISKMLIAQDTLNVESMIRRDLYNALMSKVQKTFLGSAAGTAYKPAGIFYGVTATDISSYKDLCDMEADVADSNIGGEKKYLMSNHAKAALRNMAKSVLTNELVLNNGTVDGTEIVASSDVAETKYAYGAFDSIVFGSWGDVDLIVDPYTQARKGAIRLVINAYFDWAKTRVSENVLAYGSIEEADNTEGNDDNP
jgi:HK97 family phage major capsid protein